MRPVGQLVPYTEHRGLENHVRIDVTVPDGELVASREREEHHIVG